MSRRWVIFVVPVLLGSTAASAGETVTYRCDELGCLIGAVTSSGINNGQAVTTTFDAAGNRTSYAVRGAQTGSDSGSGAATPQEPETRFFSTVSS